MLYLLIGLSAFAGTTTDTVQSSWDTVKATGSTCATYETLYAESSLSIEFTQSQIVSLRNMTVDVQGRHSYCGVYIDVAELDFGGSSLWTKLVDDAGCCYGSADWYIKHAYTPADVTDFVVGAGAWDLTVSANGYGGSNNNKIRVRVGADIEYGRDWDDDGEDSDRVGGADCDDTDNTIYTGATEIWYDGVDQNCDGLSDFDQDGDGEDSDKHGGADCNDEDADINGAATEIWYDGVDHK